MRVLCGIGNNGSHRSEHIGSQCGKRRSRGYSGRTDRRRAFRYRSRCRENRHVAFFGSSALCAQDARQVQCEKCGSGPCHGIDIRPQAHRRGGHRITGFRPASKSKSHHAEHSGGGNPARRRTTGIAEGPSGCGTQAGGQMRGQRPAESGAPDRGETRGYLL